MSQHCPGCDGIHYDVAHIDEQGRCDGFDDVDRPGVECEACAEKDAEIADLKALIAKRANVRVSVHEVWLRERKRREAADAEIAAIADAAATWISGEPTTISDHAQRISVLKYLLKVAQDKRNKEVEQDAEIARLKGAVRRLSGALTALDRSYASQFSPGHERMTKEVLADPMD